MNSILGSDLSCTDDLVIEDGDFSVVENTKCLFQDLQATFETIPADNPDMPFAGILKPRLMPNDGLSVEKTRNVYDDALSSDPRIKSDSIEIDEYEKSNGDIAFAASFETIDNQKVENFIL
ncbi:MAG: hypothetical protein JXB24_06345 [Bacteroidales bacterium]|nr:hypothetical protein [Bacteroidales bacterium]